MPEKENNEIWWDDLTPEAQERLSIHYHINFKNSPFCIIDILDEEE